MKKLLIYSLFILFPVLNKAGSENHFPKGDENSSLYSDLCLSDFGLTDQIFQLALSGRNKLDLSGQLKNPNLLTIIDFSQSSTKKRLYVIDLLHKTLLFNTFVAHGRNTGEEYATNFSNESGTHKSSLGFYITEYPAMGATVGLSLIIKGVEKGFNDKAEQRAIIMHGADYATEDFIKKHGRLGRSYGCPSVPPELIKPVSETIKGGTCLFIYHPDKNYISHSLLIGHKG
ncbi:MAG: murein L,D-transpeptidase catalytic domain family protein [Bacteroidales bacterium]